MSENKMTQDKFQELVDRVKARGKKPYVPNKAFEKDSKRYGAGSYRTAGRRKGKPKMRKRYNQGEYVGNFPDGTPYHKGDMNKERRNDIIQKIVDELPTIAGPGAISETRTGT